ncbi:MAG TPA: hypothetical protein VLL82_15630 [Mycobacterium sp.]|nr:hypothetical protein [Mycobacterium sp.]
MSITVQCPEGHYIATVDVTDDGLEIHAHRRFGLSWGYVPTLDITRVHARCFSLRCTYDGSMDEKVLYAELAAASARGETKHKLAH